MNQKKSVIEPIFVVHKHNARTLHYDLRLEEAGVLKSWAIPKGPSTDPQDKRLAIQTPDHPFSYATFEGILKEGYGAGSVLLWDTGTFENLHSPQSLTSCIEKGRIAVLFHGQKMQGEYILIRTKLHHQNSWLFFKVNDEKAKIFYSITSAEPYSVISGKTTEELEKV
ncbi:DNA ligase [Candidatus Dependentiae bacterium]|nr:DNA ligase [Candidatus Dependentiae bacterium]